MRKALSIIPVLALCATALAHAQTIQVGDRFYDGFTLFTVQEIRTGGIIYMTDASQDNELTLEAWPNQTGTYTLRPSRNADEAPYGVDFGTHVDYVSQPYNHYLVIYGDNDTVAKILPQVRPAADITAGSLWYGGELIYTVHPNEDGSVRMNASAEGEEQEFVLTPATGGVDLFEVSDGPNGAMNQYEDAAYARRLTQDGIDVICFFDSKNRITDVLQATQIWDAQALNVTQWMEMIMGTYESEGGAEVKLWRDQGLYRGDDLHFAPVTFNGGVTGVLDFGQGGPYLTGKVEALPTPEGLLLTEVKMNEGEPWYERTVSSFKLKWTEEQSRFAFASRVLLGGNLHRYDKSLLRVMRNAILAAHGYVFQSKDLKEYFEAQPWYQPAASNASVQPTLLEQLNIALIQAAERAE